MGQSTQRTMSTRFCRSLPKKNCWIRNSVTLLKKHYYYGYQPPHRSRPFQNRTQPEPFFLPAPISAVLHSRFIFAGSSALLTCTICDAAFCPSALIPLTLMFSLGTCGDHPSCFVESSSSGVSVLSSTGTGTPFGDIGGSILNRPDYNIVGL